MIVPALAAALLFIVAVAGALKPYLRPRRMVLERLSDPLDDERRMILRTLRELEIERETGALSDRDYLALRSEMRSARSACCTGSPSETAQTSGNT